jgi:hypothetical protein
LPTYACTTDGKKHEVKVACKVSQPPGSIVVINRGYTNYKLFADWSDHDIYFLTREKENADYQVLEQGPVPINRNILVAELIVFADCYAQRDCPYVLRRIVAEDKDSDSLFKILLIRSLTLSPGCPINWVQSLRNFRFPVHIDNSCELAVETSYVLIFIKFFINIHMEN